MNRLLPALLALALSPAVMAHGAHEHGVADLEVAVDGSQLAIALKTPLDNLVGFEHEPRTAAQKKALADAETRLRDFPALFVLPAAAGCALTDVSVESPWPQGDHGHAHDHGHKHDDHGHDHGAHSDMHVEYVLECANPAALNELQSRLGEAFPRMERVRVQSATPRGQGSATLTRTRNKLPL
ncbi:DUF2796 domain-containing protein [Pseudothauera lacus]|uniref:DUF2796 domain-containing protein n=1 Tax=Pseudothauera lacus TaxID=2136175 RepID=A0A2T4IJ44_9RHOO|nr:DUF2796 domain-containing protein [Pseudothauera lacus]PTD97794.1 DUF2796 domain-containing protein [Pseudothauera lacus]